MRVRREWLAAMAVGAMLVAASPAAVARDTGTAAASRPAGQAPAARPAGQRPGAQKVSSASREATARPATARGGVRAAGRGADVTQPRHGAARAQPRLARQNAVRVQPAAAPRGARGSGRMVKVSAASAPARPSIGEITGLRAVPDALDLQSSVAYVVDQATGEVLFQKNPSAVLPIASITKVMTAMVVLDAGLPLEETLEIGTADFDTEKGTGSRLRPGTRLTRAELLQLALMASENRAASALGRHYPGGAAAFVEAMNRKAVDLGMADSRFVEPTGLSGRNVSSGRDLARMVRAAHGYALIRQYSTAADLAVDTGPRMTMFRNTNRLLASADWDIGVSKTGYISEAGKCLVMQAHIDGRPTILVLLDARGSAARIGDAQRIRQWLERSNPMAAPRDMLPPARATHASLGS